MLGRVGMPLTRQERLSNRQGREPSIHAAFRPWWPREVAPLLHRREVRLTPGDLGKELAALLAGHGLDAKRAHP